ncbi:formate dehydrogenase [Brachybacterium ginsengisoli]|uniref:Formate dehydrogenase n=1 Tax=Brachybacterium ginsengisoli TaxID=1331682 RepID=A0A291GYX9_9MICO|nr:formate dehydrogenase [Brachybacterium ginsengisoli]
MQDFANADLIVIEGSNMAEAHPVAFQWVIEAKKRGARVIHVDPRFTRTSANADRHIPIRTGTDIVLLGGVIRHVLENELYFSEYVRAFTNASTIISEEYADTEDLDGLFSGFDEESSTYDNSRWAYAGDPEDVARGLPERDETLQHPRTVFQILRRHYARYTPQMVQDTCGISPEDFEHLATAIAENSGRERTTVFAYALGWTQHQGGAQMIRTAGVLQLLMGNMGRPGGGIMALRGHATIQGSTDIPTLYHILPGYLPMPKVGQDDFAAFTRAIGTKEQKGFWANADVYTINLLKAWWGDNATAENDWGYHHLPKLTGAHGTYQTTMRMLEGGVDGYFLFGQNPAVGSANGRLQRKAMAKLKWMVVRDFYMIESATFWRDGPEVESGELSPEEVGTEMFFLPAANHTEKAGSFTQTQRMVQWRDQAVEPPGDARSDLEFMYELGRRIREKLQDSTDPRDRAIQELTWDYPVNEHGEPDAEAVLAEINGRHLDGERAGRPLSSFAEMRADGSTDGGCWIYAGVYADGVNQARRRPATPEQGEIAAEWGWAWPANRRVLYNRASADPEGRPWSERKKLVWWDEEAGTWTGDDVPDFPLTKRPDDPGDPERGGAAALSGTDAFIMQSDGRGWLFAPTGLVDGPLPTHYESPESTIPNPLYSQQSNPTRVTFRSEDNLSSPGASARGGEVYPYIFTTYRITEHHTAGGMSRFLPYLAELQPEMYCEVSPELAEEVGLEPYGWATIISARSAIEAKVLVTERMTPLQVGERTVHQIGLPFHWGRGSEAIVQGDGANDLIGMNLDANTQIQNSKNNSCAILPGRRPQGRARGELVEELRRRAGLAPEEHRAVDGADGAPGAGPADDSIAHEVRGPEEASAVPSGESSIKEMRNR